MYRALISRRVAAPLLSRAFSPSVYVRSKDFQDREKSNEEKTVFEHEKMLISKLREQLKKAETKLEAFQTAEGPLAEKAPAAHGDYITFNEFMLFRKEMVSKIHSLEEEILALKFKVGKK